MLSGFRMMSFLSTRAPCDFDRSSRLASVRFSALSNPPPLMLQILILLGCNRIMPSGVRVTAAVISKGMSTTLCMMPVWTTSFPAVLTLRLRSGAPLYAKTYSFRRWLRSSPVSPTSAVSSFSVKAVLSSNSTGMPGCRLSISPSRRRMRSTISPSMWKSTFRIEILVIVSGAAPGGVSPAAALSTALLATRSPTAGAGGEQQHATCAPQRSARTPKRREPAD